MITIIDYGMGNVGSIQNMLKYLGFSSIVTNDPEKIRNAEKIILPGVGAFDAAMERIKGSGLRDLLDQKALCDKVPILGICLGMQLLTESSEEGFSSGLGWIAAKTYRFPPSDDLKVPHMGWNTVTVSNRSLLTDELVEDTRFYFVHSYYVKVENEQQSILKTHYGFEFDSAVQKDNIYGVQFHPEKSHRFGKLLFKNFARIS